MSYSLFTRNSLNTNNFRLNVSAWSQLCLARGQMVDDMHCHYNRFHQIELQQ